MAKPSWLITNPELSGSGNGTIKNSASEHTGRVARTGEVTVTAKGLETPKKYQVTQTPKEEFVEFTNGDNQAVGKEGGQVVVTGKSNAKKLNFEWVGQVLDVTIPEKYTANGSEATDDVDIPGDPGATSEYPFSITLQVPENETVEAINRTLKVETDGGLSKQIVLAQTAGDPTLDVTPTEITIPQAGTPAVDVTVTSNTSWTIS